MQLSQTVSMLLASILLFLSFADATPVFNRRSPDKFVTLPVKRYAYEPKNLHPVIVAGQIVNRGLQRLAFMTGRPKIPREFLERNLMRRVLSVEGPDGLERRFNRRSLDGTVVFDKRFSPHRPPHGPAQKGNNLAADAKDPVLQAKPPTAGNSLGLDIEAQDISYLATIQIGTPPRDFSILMDSGSANFWVGSENCISTAGGGCGNHLFLGQNSSNTFNATNIPFRIKYGTGNVAGWVIKDDVSIAGLLLRGHTFAVATLESPEFTDSASFDGLIGLAQSSISTTQQTPTPVEALFQAGLISNPVVSYKMGRSRDGNNDGEITFGGLDPSKFDPNAVVTVRNVDPLGFWTADLQDVKIGNISLGLQARKAILDTGTTLVILPDADATALHRQIPGATFDAGEGAFTIPCTTTTVVSLTFGGRVFDIDPRDMSFIPVVPGADFTSGKCISGFIPGQIGDVNEWLVGATFLKNVYFSTDTKNNTITLAKLV